MFFVPSYPGENRDEHLGEFESRSVKTQVAVEVFHLLENSHKLCRRFQQAMKARTTCFVSFIKLFSLLTKRKTVYEARTVNSHNSQTNKNRIFNSVQNRKGPTTTTTATTTSYPGSFIRNWV